MSETTKERLGDYELLALIGNGAQGRVFKARRVAGVEPDGAEFYAVKVLRFSGEDEEKVARFRQSAETLAKLNHAAIVRYYGSYASHVGEWDEEAHCLVMEYLDGESLHQLIGKNPAGLPWPDVRRIFQACLEGLIYAHAQGIIHRDIKPSNIFINHDGSVKLIDFDIARREDGSQASTAGWMGTFDFMAPDFVTVANFRGDAQSDIFSLGVCLYQALAGRLPLPPLGAGAHIGYLTRWRNPASVKSSFGDAAFRVLVNARQALTAAMHPLREKRFKTFQEMLDALLKIQYHRLEYEGRASYDLTGWVGREATGEVFLGRRVSDNLPVTIRRLFASGISERPIKDVNFLRTHPHPVMVQILDLIQVMLTNGERQFFIVLEHIGQMPEFSLRNRIKNDGALPPREAAALFIQYLSALQFLHGCNPPIIHRGFSPENLFAPPDAAEQGRVFEPSVVRDIAGNATAGTLAVSLDYVAPEFVREGGDCGTPQSDLYALALCFYEALAGRGVFEKLPSDIATAWPAFQERANRPVNPDFTGTVFQNSPALVELLNKALQHDPANRYANARQMRQRLEAILPSLSTERDPAPPHSSETVTRAPTGAGIETPPPAQTAWDDVNVTVATIGLTGPTAADMIEAAKKTAKKKPRKPAALFMLVVLVLLGAAAFVAFEFFPEQTKQYVDLARAVVGLSQKPTDVVARAPVAKPEIVHPATQVHQQISTQPPVAPPAIPRPPMTMPPTQTTAQLVVTRPHLATNPPVTPPVERPRIMPLELDAKFKRAVPSAEYALELGAEISRLTKGLPGKDVAAALATLQQQASNFPGLFQSKVESALHEENDTAAERLVSEWSLTKNKCELFGLTVAQHEALKGKLKAGLSSFRLDRELAAIRGGTPKDASAADAWKQAEELAGKITQLKTRAWPGLDESACTARIASVVAALQPAVDTGLAKAGSSRGLADLRKKSPHLSALFSDQFSQRSGTLNAGLDQFRSEIAGLIADVPASATTPAELARAEKVAAKLKDLPARSWPDVSEDDKQARIAQIKERLVPVLQAAVTTLGEAARNAAATNLSSMAAQAPLVALAKKYPAAMALVSSPYADALNAVALAWKKSLQPATPISTEEKSKPPPVDPNEEMFIAAFSEGAQAFTPQGKASFDVDLAAEVLSAAGPVRPGFNVMSLLVSPVSGRSFVAGANDLWGKAALLPGPFGDRVRNAAWQLIYTQLTSCARSTLEGKINKHTQAQQGKMRREFIKILGQIDAITGRLSTCAENDLLRVRVSMYFTEDYYSPALLGENGSGGIEDKIPWLKDKFDKAHARRGISGEGS